MAKCVHCGENFKAKAGHKAKDYLEAHLDEAHNKAPNRVVRCCIICGGLVADLSSHAEEKHGMKAPEHSCRALKFSVSKKTGEQTQKPCRKQFTAPGPRNTHEFTDHTEKECVGFTRIA